ncbi:MarR family winged helix-turn-helix transcriptional regulator [Carnobacterium sp. TMP28]|uniref:MarR family winged helix-turn-helix transcriptional regulator n=1 Tax=Carnobacterium sp. TMP28 TaxID=3397060 RepID=UPI0039E07F71
MTTNIKLMVVFGKMAHALQENLSKNLEELGMPFSLYPILAYLNEVERAKTQKLGEVAVISSGTITHTVNKLLKSHDVEKIQDEQDKRIFWIQITKEGKKRFEAVHSKHMEYLDELLKEFTEEDKVALIELMKLFGKGIIRTSELKGD